MDYCVSFFSDPVISAGVLLYLEKIGLPPLKIGTFPKSAGVCANYCLGLPPETGIKLSAEAIKKGMLKQTGPDLIIMSDKSGGGYYIFTYEKSCGFDKNLVRAGFSEIKGMIKTAQRRGETPLHIKVNGLISMEAFLKRTGSELVISVLSFEPRRDGQVMPLPARWLIVPETPDMRQKNPKNGTDAVGKYLRSTEDIWLPRVLL